MLVRYYRSVMDPNLNALNKLPSAQKFQIMLYLSLMWTSLFTAALGAYAWYDELLLGHAFILFGIFVTAHVFKRVQDDQRRAFVKTQRDFPMPDKTARYDDVWGA